MKRILLGSALIITFATSGCKRNFNNDAQTQDTGELQFNKTGPFKFDSVTPLGKRIFTESIEWLDDQPDSRAQPRNCAMNVSDVLKNAGFNGNEYHGVGDAAVRGVLTNVKAKGGKWLAFTTKSKADLIRVLNSEFKGKIPVGALVAGCQMQRCDGPGGSSHISLLGDIDAGGYTQLYHNNWYRPANEGGQYKPYMISKAHLRRGCERQWMPTPWLKFIRNADGTIADVASAYPGMHGIDDLDPFAYYLHIGVTKELMAEVSAGLGTTGEAKAAPIECPQGYTLKELGAGKMCGDGTNAWGPFTEAMKAKCLAWSPNDPVCSSDRWGWELAKNARGTGVCPVGATLDLATGYCVEGANAFGPFPAALVAKCEAANGGSACKSARWSRTFLKGLLGE